MHGGVSDCITAHPALLQSQRAPLRGTHCAGVYVPLIASYDDFVRVSKDIMRGRSPEDQRLLVANMTRVGATEPLTVFDHKSKLVFTNK